MKRSQTGWILVLALILLVLGGLGASLPGLVRLASPATLSTAVPTVAPSVAPTGVAAAQDENTQISVVNEPAADADSATASHTEDSIPESSSPLFDEQGAAIALEAQIVSIYETVNPAVVNITSRGYAYDWFGRAVPQEGSGSGFFYDTDGHILTNYHVVENADELLVTLTGDQVYTAQIVGTDPVNDLAVLQIEAGADLPAPLTIGGSNDLHVGQFVLAIGNPFGLDSTLTTGVISALGRVIESPEDAGFIGEAIQTDASINPGNSGGPLLDLNGRVIGVNSQIISPSGASAGIGFAVSASTVERVVPELIARGHYPHPWLGAEMLTLTPSTIDLLREAGMDLPVASGLLVTGAPTGTPVAKAGIRGSSQWVPMGRRYQVPVDGDVIIAIDGLPIANHQDLTVYLETETTVGDTVELTIVRDGEEMVIPVTLEEQPQGRVS